MTHGIGYFIGDAACLCRLRPDVFQEVCRPEEGAGFGGDKQFAGTSFLEDVEALPYCLRDRDLSDPIDSLWGVVFLAPDDGDTKFQQLIPWYQARAPRNASECYALLNTLRTFWRIIEAWFKNSAPVDTLISLRLSPYPKNETP